MKTSQFKYELYTDHELHEHRYVVLSPDGFDLLGEHVPLWDAAGVVKRENAILDICAMPEILSIVEELRDANETPMVWIDDLLHHPDVSDVHLRALVRKPAYLRSLVVWLEKQEAKHADHLNQRKADNELKQSVIDEYASLLNALPRECIGKYNALAVTFRNEINGKPLVMGLNDQSASAIVEFLSNNYTLTLK